MRALAPTLQTLQSTHDTPATQHRCAGVVAFGAPRAPNTCSSIRAHRLVSVARWLAAALALVALAACGDDSSPADTSCDPNVAGSACVCTDASDALCDPSSAPDGSCACAIVEEDPDNIANNGLIAPNPSPSPTGWRFVLVEDSTSPVAGDFPGLDLDAIELTDHDGTTHFASTVEDFNLGGGTARDPSQVLGPPDSNCDANSGTFLSLGGADADGYAIVGFSNAGRDVTFRAGSTIIVHDVGGSMCGQFDDDPFAVSISISTDRASFTQVGTGSGIFSIPVTSNP